jgi:hypothetical protein
MRILELTSVIVAVSGITVDVQAGGENPQAVVLDDFDDGIFNDDQGWSDFFVIGVPDTRHVVLDEAVNGGVLTVNFGVLAGDQGQSLALLRQDENSLLDQIGKYVEVTVAFLEGSPTDSRCAHVGIHLQTRSFSEQPRNREDVLYWALRPNGTLRLVGIRSLSQQGSGSTYLQTTLDIKEHGYVPGSEAPVTLRIARTGETEYSFCYGFDGAADQLFFADEIPQGARLPIYGGLNLAGGPCAFNATFENYTVGTIVPPPPPPRPPQAEFTLEQLPDGQEVRLDASASTTGEGHAIVSYAWDFGDGVTAEGRVVTHTYQAPGVFHVALEITDDRQLTARSVRRVVVSGDVSPWTALDIGGPTLPGGALSDESCLRIAAAAGNLNAKEDRFHFTNQEITGDFELKARIATWSAVTRSSKLGLMIRGSLDADAQTVAVVLERRNAGFRHRFLHRDAKGRELRGTSHDDYATPAVWLRLARRGPWVSSSLSTDGISWFDPDSVELAELPERVYAGVASSSPDPLPENVRLPISTLCDLQLQEPNDLIRGDCDGDGRACSGVHDALALLNWLFLGRSAPPCLAACDPDGNGELELADAVYALNFCFKGTDPPVAPFPACGPGAEADAVLGCETSTCE